MKNSNLESTYATLQDQNISVNL